MKYKDEYKVEFKTVPVEYVAGSRRYIYYRIVPYQLSLLQRWFSNPWQQLYKPLAFVDAFSFEYSPKEYQDEVVPLKTYGDVRKYLVEARLAIKKRRAEKIEKCEIWPDEI